MDNRFSAHPGTTNPVIAGIAIGGRIRPAAVALIDESSTIYTGIGAIFAVDSRLALLLTRVSVHPVSTFYTKLSVVDVFFIRFANLANFTRLEFAVFFTFLTSSIEESESKSDN